MAVLLQNFHQLDVPCLDGLREEDVRSGFDVVAVVRGRIDQNRDDCQSRVSLGCVVESDANGVLEWHATVCVLPVEFNVGLRSRASHALKRGAWLAI